MHLITAVITTHKRAPEFVQRALDSVLAQTYPHMEIIVVDDSPADFEQRDQIKQLVEAKGAQYIAHDVCKGACAARNTGLAVAGGEYIAFLDDDDEWLPEKIEKQVAKFTDNVALVYCGSKVCYSSTNTTVESVTAYRRGSVYAELLKTNFIGATSFPLLRRSSLMEIGGFDIMMQSAQDYDVWLRLAQRYEVDYVSEALAVYYIHTSDRITQNYQKKVAGLERIIAKNQSFLRQNPRAYWGRNMELAPYYAGNGQLGRSILTWVKAAVRCPWELKENLRHLYWIMRIIMGKQ